MKSNLRELLEQAAEQQKRTWETCLRIYAALGYEELPKVTDALGAVCVAVAFRAVCVAVARAAFALGTANQRIELFRAQQTLEEKRARAG